VSAKGPTSGIRLNNGSIYWTASTPPIADARVPNKVIPICTADKNLSGFSFMLKRVFALLFSPDFIISLILLFREETMAISPAENIPFKINRKTIRIISGIKLFMAC